MFKNPLITAFFLIFSASVACSAETAEPVLSVEDTRLREYLLKVYNIMDKEYYLPVQKPAYDAFVAEFPAGRLKAMNDQAKKTPDYIHLGAGLLVNRLKNPADRFTNFVPPQLTKSFKEKAYATTEDLGIEGKKTKKGFEVTRVQKHSQAAEKGLKAGDVILSIGGTDVLPLGDEAVKKLLAPASGAKVIVVFLKAGKTTTEIELEATSYYRETVVLKPTDIKGVAHIQITHFNRVTAEDFADALKTYGVPNMKHLVIDLRHNEGGPPLAAREILGFFLPQNDPLFAIARKKRRPVMMTAPLQPVMYAGPVTVLVDERTGSASEMFSGLLQTKKIGKLIGQKTAGATYLKSMFDIEDGATVFMITSLTFFYDRRVYPADGLTPDVVLPPGQDSLEVALAPLR